MSCQTSDTSISGDSSLKSLPKSFFIKNSTHTITISENDVIYTSQFERLPNTEFSKFYLRKHPEAYSSYFNVTINLNKDSKITLEGVEVFKNELLSYTKEFIDFAAEGKPTLLHLNFEEDVLLKDYIAFINFISLLKSAKVTLSPKVFIYNPKLLPDCNCTL
ncbi:MAG: hypothetical protein ACPGU9_06285 [Flavobacteriaceae bacterium]